RSIRTCSTAAQAGCSAPWTGDVAAGVVARDAWHVASFGAATGAALVAGSLACLCLPELPPWPVLALAFGLGLRGWVWGRAWGRVAGVALLGLGLCGLHAAATLAAQLPPAFERADVRIAGRVVDLPRHEPDRTAFRFRVDDDLAQPPHLRGRQLQLAWYD